MPMTDHATRCPVTGATGRPVPQITVKALLRPHALATFDPAAQHYYCPDPVCDTVYFAEGGTFGTADVKVLVFEKQSSGAVPVCYCFGWTRDRLLGDLAARGGAGHAAEEIRAHVQAGRCACDVNNPKGVCCLGDVQRFLAEVRRSAR